VIYIAAMRDKQLYAAILGIKAPWQVEDVILDRDGLEVRVRLSYTGRALAECPECGEKCPGYDTRRRSWRHLDTCQFKTTIEADVPRVSCKKHNVIQIHVPWAEPGSGFTALMEALVIDWLMEANTKALAKLQRLTWDQVDGIKQRAVKRGLARRAELEPTGICIDETSFQKRHEYVTVSGGRLVEGRSLVSSHAP
jgi:transposase